MIISDFFNELNEIMQRDEPLDKDELLENIEEWDSMSALAFMSFFDIEFGITLSIEQIKAVKSVQDMIVLAGDNITK